MCQPALLKIERECEGKAERVGSVLFTNSGELVKKACRKKYYFTLPISFRVQKRWGLPEFVSLRGVAVGARSAR